MKTSYIGSAGFTALLSMAIYAAPALASDPTALTRLVASNICENCDFSGADLSNKGLKGARLNGAYLRDAYLNSVVLSKAILTNVDFSYADLTDANLNGADLTGAKMEGTNLTGADLMGAIIDKDLFKFATVCRTIMPNDEMSTRDCAIDNPDQNPSLLQR